jgi:Zn finger protein HypA/HybF involved in hydrogenase expression
VLLYLAMLVVIPLGVMLLLGSRTWAKMTPLTFECRRCNRSFERAAWKRFPRRCEHCGARDWNV